MELLVDSQSAASSVPPAPTNSQYLFSCTSLASSPDRRGGGREPKEREYKIAVVHSKDPQITT